MQAWPFSGLGARESQEGHYFGLLLVFSLSDVDLKHVNESRKHFEDALDTFKEVKQNGIFKFDGQNFHYTGEPVLGKQCQFSVFSQC